MNRITFLLLFSTALFPIVKKKSLIIGCLNYATPSLLLIEFNGNVATSFYDVQNKVHKDTDCVSVVTMASHTRGLPLEIMD